MGKLFELLDRHETVCVHMKGHIPFSMTILWMVSCRTSFEAHPALESGTHLRLIPHWTRLFLSVILISTRQWMQKLRRKAGFCFVRVLTKARFCDILFCSENRVLEEIQGFHNPHKE